MLRDGGIPRFPLLAYQANQIHQLLPTLQMLPVFSLELTLISKPAVL